MAQQFGTALLNIRHFTVALKQAKETDTDLID